MVMIMMMMVVTEMVGELRHLPKARHHAAHCVELVLLHPAKPVNAREASCGSSRNNTSQKQRKKKKGRWHPMSMHMLPNRIPRFAVVCIGY